MEIKLNFTKGQSIALAVTIVGLLALYHVLLNNSVEAGKEYFRSYLVLDCKSGIDIPEPGKVDEESAQKLLDDIAACESIKIDDISANGGVLLSVSIRAELGGEGYVPKGEKVRYFSMRRLMVFPFTTFKIISGDWSELAYSFYRSNAFFHYVRL